jgi:hypothetical protein
MRSNISFKSPAASLTSLAASAALTFKSVISLDTNSFAMSTQTSKLSSIALVILRVWKTAPTVNPEETMTTDTIIITIKILI